MRGRGRPCAVLGVLVLACTSSFGARSSVQLFAPVSDVSFSISTGRARYAADEDVVVSYRIVNESTGPLFVPRLQFAKCPAAFPHLAMWFESDTALREIRSYAGSCLQNIPPVFQLLAERMKEEAVLLRPGEAFTGQLVKKFPADWPAGNYRIVASLTGWPEERFTQAERNDLPKLGSPVLGGQLTTSTRVDITR